MKAKVCAFLLPVVPWVLYAAPFVGEWLSDDPWNGIGLAMMLWWPGVILTLVFGAVGVLCALRCYRETKQKRYWIALAMATVTACCGVLLLAWLIGLM